MRRSWTGCVSSKGTPGRKALAHVYGLEAATLNLQDFEKAIKVRKYLQEQSVPMYLHQNVVFIPIHNILIDDETTCQCYQCILQ